MKGCDLKLYSFTFHFNCNHSRPNLLCGVKKYFVTNGQKAKN